MEQKQGANNSQERGQNESRRTDPNAKERARKGDVRQKTDPESYDDEFETAADDEIIQDEGRSEKENRPGKS